MQVALSAFSLSEVNVPKDTPIVASFLALEIEEGDEALKECVQQLGNLTQSAQGIINASKETGKIAYTDSVWARAKNVVTYVSYLPNIKATAGR